MTTVFLTQDEFNKKINHLKFIAYKNAAINAKVNIGVTVFYKNALETIKYYKSVKSHKVETIQAYCNLMGYSQL